MSKILYTLLFCITNVYAFTPSTYPKMSLLPQDRRQFMNTVGKSLAVTPLLSLRKARALTIEEKNQIAIYQNALPSVCYITTEYNITEKQSLGLDKNPKGVGSGFIYDNNGHIVTNFHVINRCINATVKFTNLEGMTKEYIPQLVGYDSDKDIAVLKINNESLLPLPQSSNKEIQVGQYCYAIGNPFGKPFSFTMGIISGKNREINAPSGRKIADILQADVPINRGNSGGCLLDSSGKLIGVNTAIFGGDVSTGISLSISVDTVKQTVENILKNGIIEHSTLGIEYLTNLPSKKDLLNTGLPFIDKGVIILKVVENSAAAKAGLKGLEKKEFGKAGLGDVIIGINDKHIKDADEMLEVLEKYKPNDVVKLNLLRGNEMNRTSVNVTLGSNEDVSIGLQLVQ
jgi:S1-C subfamily serine protease